MWARTGRVVMSERGRQEWLRNQRRIERQELLNELEVRLGAADARGWLSEHRDRLGGKTALQALEDDELDRVREILPNDKT